MSAKDKMYTEGRPNKSLVCPEAANLVTGILAMIIGLLVAIWSIAFIHRKYGAGVLLVLSIILWLVGGGFAPIFFTILVVPLRPG